MAAQPAQGDTPPHGVTWVEMARAVGLGALTISLSVTLISFNKLLMQPHHFPYAAPLAAMHMAFCSTSAAVLLGIAPSLFPALTHPARKVNMDRRFILRGVVPIGFAFAATLVCANLAYSHLSVAFLQMMKETNLVLVYVFSLMAALERFAWWQVHVIAFAMLAALLTVRGELHFSLAGFVIQASGQVFEASRIVAMGVLLSGKRLDALSCVLVLSPACLVVLGSFLGLVAVMPAGSVPATLALPSAEKVYEFAPLLLLNCIIAFALNVSTTLMIKYTSAVSYIFMGVLKDVVAVVVSVVVLHEEVSGMQRFAFCMQIFAVLVWSLLKSAPPEVQERGIAGAAVALFQGPPAKKADAPKDGEEKPLLARGAKI